MDDNAGAGRCEDLLEGAVSDEIPGGDDDESVGEDLHLGQQMAGDEHVRPAAARPGELGPPFDASGSSPLAGSSRMSTCGSPIIAAAAAGNPRSAADGEGGEYLRASGAAEGVGRTDIPHGAGRPALTAEGQSEQQPNHAHRGIADTLASQVLISPCHVLSVSILPPKSSLRPISSLTSWRIGPTSSRGLAMTEANGGSVEASRDNQRPPS